MMAYNENRSIRGLEKAISKIAEKEGFQNPKIINRYISSDGANYMAELYLIDVEEYEKQTLYLFAKVTNIPEPARPFIPANAVYQNEVIIYTTVACEFQELQEKHGIPEEKRFTFPKYYESNLEKLEEVIVLENLAATEYAVLDRTKAYDWNYAKSALQELAKFHALSYALKHASPERFEIIKKSLRNAFSENLVKDPKATIDLLLSHHFNHNFQDIEAENREILKKYIEENRKNLLVKYVYPTSNAVIVHGDYRASNIMVKYEGESIVSIIPIDYQTASYGNPVNDIIYLLFTGSDEHFRQQYFDKFLEHYYACLSNFLELLSLDIRTIYPKYCFYFDVREAITYGLEIGLLLLNSILVETKDKYELGNIVSHDKMKEAFENFKPSQSYINRLNGIVRDFKRWRFFTNDTFEREEQQTEKAEKGDSQIVNAKEVISTIAETEGFLNFRVDIKPIFTKGANFVGDVYYVEVSEKSKETLKLFAKASNMPKETRKFIRISEMYKNEVLMYTTVASAFHELQKRHRIPEKRRYQFIKYYGSNLNHMEELVVLENLGTQGYESKDRFTTLDWEYAKAALEEIAKFHALSFALKAEMPEVFNKIRRRVKNILEENMRKLADSTSKNVASRTLSIVNPENKALWEKFLDEYKDKFMYRQFEVTEQYGVIIHGDYRVSNILHKSQGGAVISIKPVDYQTVYFGSPVQDIIYLLFLASDESFRGQHFEKYLEHYYSSLGTHLKMLSQDVSVLYPKSVFYFDLKDRILRSGLDATLFVLPTVLVQPGLEMKLAEMTDPDAMNDVYTKAMPNEQVYNERFNGIVRDLVRWGFLK